MIAEHPLVNKMIRAAKLDVHLYEEVERDTTANGQALAAVAIASVAGGIGAGLGGLLTEGGAWFLWGLIIGLVTGLVGWLIWSGITYWLGTTILRVPATSATYGELLRTIGFSNSPRVLSVFSFIPVFGGLVLFIASIWALVAGVIAVRQALEFSTGRAIVTVIVGWLVYVVLVFPVLLLVT
jgi:hypothetical protein